MSRTSSKRPHSHNFYLFCGVKVDQPDNTELLYSHKINVAVSPWPTTDLLFQKLKKLQSKKVKNVKNCQ